MINLSLTTVTRIDTGHSNVLTERKRVADPHRRVGCGPSASLIAGQVAPEPALEQTDRQNERRASKTILLRALHRHVTYDANACSPPLAASSLFEQLPTGL